MFGIISYLLVVIFLGKQWAEFIIFLFYISIMMYIRKRYNARFLVLLMMLAAWIYHYTRNNFVLFEKRMTYANEVVFIEGYTWGMIHIIAHRSISNIVMNLIFDAIVLVLKIIVLYGKVPLDAFLTHLAVVIYVTSSHIWSENQNRKFFQEITNSKNALIKFKEFMAKHLSSALVVLNSTGKEAVFTNDMFKKAFEEESEKKCHK